MTAAFSETLHYLDLSDGPRFAVVTHPSVTPTGTGVLLCSGGWFPGSWNFNRVYVKLARSLAAQGHKVVRFDWYGSGESPGFRVRFRLAEPPVEDLVRAASLLDGCQRIVGAGNCLGAVALLSGAHRIDRLAGLALVSVSVPGGGPKVRARRLTTGKVLRSALDPSIVRGWLDPYTRRLYLKWLRLRWRAISRQLGLRRHNPPDRFASMAIQVEDLVKEGTLLWFVYGEGDSNLPAFFQEPLMSICASPNVSVEVIR